MGIYENPVFQVNIVLMNALGHLLNNEEHELNHCLLMSAITKARPNALTELLLCFIK